jgi:RNA polymerase sigma-70 factor, ECF subfamily
MSMFGTPEFDHSRSPAATRSLACRSSIRESLADLETAGDTDLIRRVAEGNAAAFTSLYGRYATSVYHAIFRILRNIDIAQEVHQEAFLRVWNQASTFQADKGTFAAWLHRIARNLALDELRHQRCRPRLMTGDQSTFINHTMDARQDVEYHAIARVLGEATLEAIARLPPTQRQAVELAYLQEMTHREVAAVLNQPLGTIKSRISMGAAKIRADLVASI